jgi:cytochrome c
VTTASIFPGTYTATVTLSAPGVTSRNVTVTFMRQATLAGDVQPIFTASCASCHGNPGADLVNLSTSAASFAALVNNHSSDNTAILVVPGNSAGSYLVNVVNGTAQVQDNMPPGCTSSGAAPCLAATSRQLITIWIQQGARQNP